MKLYIHDIEAIAREFKKLIETKLDIKSFTVNSKILVSVERTTDQRDGVDYYITKIESLV